MKKLVLNIFVLLLVGILIIGAAMADTGSCSNNNACSNYCGNVACSRENCHLGVEYGQPNNCICNYYCDGSLVPGGPYGRVNEWKMDSDGDSYSKNFSDIRFQISSPGVGWYMEVKDVNDCNDNNAYVNPGVSENCFNSIDDDCDGQINEGCTNINTTYWADMNGQNISNSSLGDTVLMVYGGYQLTDKIINYTVQEYNSSFVWWNPFRWFSKDWNGANKISGNANEPWVITNQNPKRFNATIIGTSVWNVSKNLTINNENNSRPIINLVNPVDGIYVAVNSSTRFNQTSNDEDDLLKITWDFGDGKNATFYNYSSYINSSSANVEHNYTSPGIYYWTLTSEEMNRNQKDSKERVIYVFEEGVNVVPIISSPFRGQAAGTDWITFNASQTFVINCTKELMTSKNFTTSDGVLNCAYLHAPGSYVNQNLSGYYLTFNWNFGNNDKRSGNWSAGDSYANVVEFYYKYDTDGKHDISLNVEYGLK